MKGQVSAGLVSAGTVAAGGLAYWLCMSPYSQALGRWPYRANGAGGAEKVVALTFDDGPNEPYTTQLADFLLDRGVRATFFQVGRCVHRHPEASRRLLADGHVIGNHSVSHLFREYLKHPDFARQIEDNQYIIAQAIGRTPALYRSPWLWRTPPLLATLRRNRLQPVSGVFCHDLEVAQIPAERIAEKALQRTRPGRIIIFHDGREGRGGQRGETIRAVKLYVDALLSQGYRFVTVDELLGVPAYQD